MLVPEIDIAACSLCEGCIAICPEVFRLNPDTGYVEVIEMASYPEALVNEAIRDCPQDCISWQPAGA